MNTRAQGPERRQHIRIKKHFILTYYDKANPQKKRDATQIKNISVGGMCILTAEQFQSGAIIGIEMKTPYLSGTVSLEGKVLQSHERLAGIVYETRLTFQNLNAQAEFVLKKIVEYYKEKG